MNTAQRLLGLAAQLHHSPGLTVDDLDDLKLLAACGLPLQARRGRYRLGLEIAGTPLDLEETLAATLALLMTSCGPAVATKRNNGIVPS
ncbi:MAG: hypothetical protein KF760_20895 [Candidatus Eremiobacteraeota bacterium]|nr:hypothetical protein [Candidatus Eremiobacteraeota bacterium]MCW5871166.1 hypothetical protein [Candidatus Eremiobacteraeota bacterium]